MIYQDKKESMEAMRDTIEYAASFFFGEEIQKMREKRQMDEKSKEWQANAKLMEQIGLKPDVNGQPSVSGILNNFNGLQGGVIGEDPISVLESLKQTQPQDNLANSILNADINLNRDDLDEVVVIRHNK